MCVCVADGEARDYNFLSIKVSAPTQWVQQQALHTTASQVHACTHACKYERINQCDRYGLHSLSPRFTPLTASSSRAAASGLPVRTAPCSAVWPYASRAPTAAPCRMHTQETHAIAALRLNHCFEIESLQAMS